MNRRLVWLMGAMMVAVGSGCVGTSALRVNSVPEGATLYANGRSVGQTPKTLPVNWGYYLLYARCDATQIRIEKDGFEPVEATIDRAAIGRRNLAGNYLDGSEFGSGRTYLYMFHLKPVR